MARVARLIAVLALACWAVLVGATPVALWTMNDGAGGLIGPGSKAGVCEQWATMTGPRDVDPAGSFSGSAQSDGCHMIYNGGDRGANGMNPAGTYDTHSCPAAGATVPHDSSQSVALPGAPGGPIQEVCDNGCSEVNQKTYGAGVDRVGIGDATSTGHSCGLNAAAGQAGPSDGGGLPASGAAEAASAPASSDPSATPSPSNCAARGQSYGTVGSTGVCVDGGASSSTVSSSTATSATGGKSSQATTTTVADNNDGTATTTTTTFNSDGSTSTTTTTGPGGSKGGGGAGAGGGSCSGTGCGNSDSFGGSCGGEFTCDGEAVQCAIAQEQHERDCMMFQPDTVPGIWQHGAQTLATAKSDGDHPSWSPSTEANWDTKNFDWSSTIDQSNPMPGGCPGDRAIGSFAGQSIVLPLSSLCPYVGILGNFLVAFTSLACALILFKGTK